MSSLFFVIPLRPRASATNWDKVVSDFNASLRSVLNQTDPRFRVLVACTDIPEYPRDDRLEVFQVEPMSEPSTVAKVDQNHKLKALCVRVRQLGGGFIMPVDADDLISNRISSLVHTDASTYGYYASTGWEYDDRNGRLRVAPNFHHFCGTCAVMLYEADELPASMDDDSDAIMLTSPPSGLYRWHAAWKRRFDEVGKPLRPFPFRPAIYRIGTGENTTMRAGRPTHSWRRRIFRALAPPHRITNAIRAEFSL